MDDFQKVGFPLQFHRRVLFQVSAIQKEAHRFDFLWIQSTDGRDNDRLRVMISRSGGWILAGVLPGTKMQRSCKLRELHKLGLIDRGVDLCLRKNARQIVPVEPDDPERKVYVRLTDKGYEQLRLAHERAT